MGNEIVVEVGEGTEDEGWVETHGHQGDSGVAEPATEMTLEPAKVGGGWRCFNAC